MYCESYWIRSMEFGYFHHVSKVLGFMLYSVLFATVLFEVNVFGMK